MAKVSLRSYNREIEGFIEHGQLDEAIAHCRHILKFYPKHLETYRLLGKAYLEAKRYKEAVDIFQRVLMAVPDDFVSHVGMSIINDDSNKLDESIWHMERAFEVQPSNGAIQGELQRLFGRRDGMEPPKIRLTRGALAHMYVQGELYPQAISEIRAVLNNDPQRADMQVLLAKAYFLGGQKPEATENCAQLIKRYPYSLDANRILVELLPGTQRADSAQTYQQRVNELDPYAAFAQESVFRTEEVADGAVSLERLEYSGQSVDLGASWSGVKGIALPAETPGSGNPSAQPEWLKAAASSPTPPAQVPAAGQPIPDFLRQAGWTESQGEVPEESPSLVGAIEPEAAESSAVQADLPDWIKAMAPAGAAAAGSTPAASDMPDWLKDTVSEQPSAPARPATAPASEPDWLKGPGKSGPVEPESEEPLTDTGWLRGLSNKKPPEPIPESEEPLSDTGWLKRLGEEQPSPTASKGEPAAEETPEWLKGLDNDLEIPFSSEKVNPPASTTPPPAPSPVAAQPTPEPVPGQPSNLGELGTSAQEQDDAMAWLESLAAKHGAKPEELVTDPNARTDVAPEWVDKAKELGDKPQTRELPTSSENEAGMWLRNLETPGFKKGVSTAELTPSDGRPQTPDWLSGLTDKDAFKGMAETAEEKEEPPIIGSQEAPAWLNELGPKTVPPAPHAPETPAEGSVPGWLKPSGPAVPPVEETRPQTTPLAEPLPAAELPDWLAGLEKEEPRESAPTTGELPDWLLAEPKPETTERTQPADWQPVEPLPADFRETPVTTVEPVVIGKPEVRQPEPEETRPVKKPSPAPVRPKQPTVLPKSAEVSLEVAQAEMGRGNIAASLEMYNRLIRKARSLEEIIRDLRDALYRYPVEVPIWQSLGDAYMRANRLQEALDAYTKAEELLR